MIWITSRDGGEVLQASEGRIRDAAGEAVGDVEALVSYAPYTFTVTFATASTVFAMFIGVMQMATGDPAYI